MAEVTRMPGRHTGRKPIHLVAASGYRTPQDAVWEALRALRNFCQADIELWVVNKGYPGINSATVKSYLQRLEKGQYIACIRTEPVKGSAAIKRFELRQDVGLHAPRLTADGRPSTQGQGRENLWRSMKILSSFDFHELAEAASTDEVQVKSSEAKSYIKHLYKAGYLQRLKAGSSRIASRYRLLPGYNTGPRPPMVQRIKRVFDPNLNQVMGEEVGNE